MSKIYEYAVLFHPRKKKDDEKQALSTLIVDVTRVVASDEKAVAMLAARSIPEEYVEKLDQVEIAIRPF